MDRAEDDFISLQDAIAIVKDEFGEGSNVTKILEAVMQVMVYEFDDISLNNLEELCR